MSNLPSPEQQETTARRYRGRLVLPPSAPLQKSMGPPEKAVEADQPPATFSQMIWHWARWLTFWTLIGLIVGAIGAHQVDGPHFSTTYSTAPAYPAIYPTAHGATVVLAVALGVMVAFWFLLALGYYLRLVWRTTGEAMTSIPSLAEIDQQLRSEGYDPSIADVVAMHGYLTSQRNDAAFLAGALIVGPHLLARQAQGKPLI
jgi:hypothetical protein